MMTHYFQYLKESPMFYFSLHAKELFHSNFLAWIASLSQKDEPLLGKRLFKEIFKKLDVDTSKWGDEFKVLREKNHLDLSVTSCDGKTLYLIIENKVKSIPDLEQIKWYNKKKDIKGAFKILLTFVKEILDKDKYENIGWKIIGYDELSKALDVSLPNKYHSLILDDYRSFIDNLYKISTDYIYSGLYTIPFSKELKENKILDLFEKIRVSLIAKHITKILNDPLIKINTGYGQGGGLVEVRKKVGFNTEMIIQIEGDQYRRALEVSSNITFDDIQKLFPDFLATNRQELSQRLSTRSFYPIGTSTKIKGSYCKYTSNGKIFYYQYSVIPQNSTITEVAGAMIEDITTN